MNADGTDRQAIVTTSAYPFASRPSWSPGGTQIAFIRNNPGSPVSIQADVVVIDLATRVETVVSRPVDFGGALADADEIEPAWSPDGGRIAFAGVRPETYPDPITGAPTTGAQWEIVTVNPDGSGEQIVSAGGRGSLRAQYLEEDRAPAWSPDGSKIVFMSQAQIPSCCGPWQIWAVNRDGSGASNLTSDETVNDMFPSWSPDGTQIIFSRSTGAGGFDLYTMPAPATLPVTAPLVTKRIATSAVPKAATGPASPLTNDGNSSDPDWQRTPGTWSPGSFGLYLTVAVQGKGAGGSVTSSPAGIKCERDCTEPYAPGTPVVLTAVAKKGSVFAGWSGACLGIATTCQVTMNDVKSVGATFVRAR
jgi:dipeptidyl aminopeptidase/acylaminoacyl peptidase